MRKKWGAFFLLAAVLAALYALVSQDLANKSGVQSNDRMISLAVDWEDVKTFEIDLQSTPASYVVLPWSARLEAEQQVRRHQRRILWRLDDEISPEVWLRRFQKNDAVFLPGAHVLERPHLRRELPGLLRTNDGLLVLVEFVPNPLLKPFASKLKDRLIKGHVLPTRELIHLKPSLWKKRLVRAVEERWVRFLIIRYSPSWSREQNHEFQKSVVEEFIERGFLIGASTPFSTWPVRFGGSSRLKVAGLLAVFVPVVLLIFAVRFEGPAFINFLIICGFSLVTGVVIHGLGATPESVIGLSAVRAVKLQLILPLLLSLLFLVTPVEWAQLLDQPVRVKHALWATVILVGFVGLYLMRSGNHPLLPVTDSERGIRDFLERWLIARPRFKECFFGHPLLLSGLLLKRKFGSTDFRVRICLLIGLIGQISILNTFMHFHSPLMVGVVRTINGIWIGSCLALPTAFLLHWRK